MNNQIKILLTIQGIEGGTLRLVGKQVIRWKNSKKDVNPKYKGKDENVVVAKGFTEVNDYEVIPCSRNIKMTQDAYDYLTSEDSKPRDVKLEKSWKKMSKRQRLEVHFSKMCEEYGGTSFIFSVLED